MSHSRVPKPSRRVECGVLLPVEIETTPATVTDTLRAALNGHNVLVSVTQHDPRTLLPVTALVELKPHDMRHFIGELTRLTDQAEAAEAGA